MNIPASVKDFALHLAKITLVGQSFILLFQERAAVLIPRCCMQKPEFSLLYFFISVILDIHAAAKEIAEVNEINLEKIWDMLLEKWLCPSTMPGEMSACLLTAQVCGSAGAEFVFTG